jgi:hypothetical protein
MYSEVKSGAHTGGDDMPTADKAKAEEIIELFEARLNTMVSQQGIPRRHIRPLAPGSVVCGNIGAIVFVGYFPQLAMPTVSFMTLTQTGTGTPTVLAFHSFLMDRTGQDFSVVLLDASWLALEEAVRSSTLDAVALQVVQNELSRVQVQTTMIPFNPVFGPNRFPIQPNLVFTLMPFEAGLTAEAYPFDSGPAICSVSEAGRA